MDTIFKFGRFSKGSSGFGLYYCKMVVEANRGKISISNPGKGKRDNRVGILRTKPDPPDPDLYLSVRRDFPSWKRPV